ncbi:MAG: HEAT repeat domain-containing protein [Flexilinea sp.]|nr:HEAT repeat domain-containing protein [Flexilinea sp.]
MADKSLKKTRAGFGTVLDAIRQDPEGVFGSYARMLSDLTAEKTAQLKPVLAALDRKKKAAFFRCMDVCNSENFIYDFSPIAMIGLDDPDGEVRRASINILGLEDSREIGSRMLDLALNDPYEEAQIAAIRVLGEYMYEADIENAIPVSKKKLRETLAALLDSEKKAVRRAAVVAYALSNDERVRTIISGYLAGNDPEELNAALTAVHLSMSEEWNDSVLELISHDDDDVRCSAFRTAGTLQLKEALPELYEVIADFDRVPPHVLLAAAEAVAEIGYEDSLDVLETLGEAAVDLDHEIAEAIDDCIDTLNMTINMGPSFEEEEWEQQTSEEEKAELFEKLADAKERCLAILEEKIPQDLEDDEPIDPEDEDDDEECECGEHHHHHHDHEHHHHDNPLEGMDLSRFRILDDLEAYEAGADLDEDEEELWADFEAMAEEDLDADSLQDFINKLEKKRKKK